VLIIARACFVSINHSVTFHHQSFVSCHWIIVWFPSPTAARDWCAFVYPLLI
jgi:acyl-CoA thioesterase